ncbi:MgtC/SapB family protein [Serpentinicella sp. ANB-PHB4]|uniref:MgtC/SapB family protein n=1 Tax=Serpentinicella sp. ANB-PHB4 TaxID=3074076 RepID=UPI002855A8BE|nr:MgtC/SapB family protein [Serpentinicella sp. ANB-PHB4]MDR5659899.1 MgtC/SapB family protein [Serpentinicella sp. ANB-PHB4]
MSYFRTKRKIYDIIVSKILFIEVESGDYMISSLDLIVRLVVASLLGGLIGFEREVNNRPAGFRTHILVTLGSCLIMILSIYGFVGLGPEGKGGEPARLAAQVVSGIGFLGAGTIMREGMNVRGLTTAASIWISGGIGLAIGAGFYVAAVVTTLLSLASLTSVQLTNKRLSKMKRYSEVEIKGIGRPGLVGEIGMVFGKHYISIKNIQLENYATSEEDMYEESIQINFYIITPVKLEKHKVCNDLGKIKGLNSVVWDDVKVINHK